MSDTVSEAVCEACGSTMSPYSYDGVSGYACSECGWGFDIDTNPEPDPRSMCTTKELDIEELKYRNSVLESLMHKVNLYHQVTLNTIKVREILDAMDMWSYAHRMGNGTLTDEQIKNNTDRAFARLAELVMGE